ncbi:sugar phosphate isomerase/epimerase [Nonomuraea sp. K274]|uniref:Sugar phosphate isomerase/epimerase n=1 Tax=Nonomuraea cypriaca TaxID=1187855 RepID=A0A931EWH5_9ACTN|nr:sugar phosphate isomerase/epimerase family protein [Nonomuraea cypriaca]MBF8185225.1 sugar phosphate isomerase/epimerase [Nonomuraea cypriaca]
MKLAVQEQLLPGRTLQEKFAFAMDAELGGIGVMTPASWGQFSRRLPPFEPPRTPEEDREVLAEALGILGEHAQRNGVLIMLEPLNRYENHMVNTLAEAVSYCAMDSIRVVGDTYHMNIEEDDPCRSLIEAAPYIAHIQISESNRNQPGTGHLDWSAQLATLDAVGYDGYLALECRLRGDPEIVLPQTAAFVRKYL